MVAANTLRGMPMDAALGDSLGYTLTLALCGYLYGFAAPYLRHIQPRIAVALLVQALALGVTLAAVSLFGESEMERFPDNLPLHLIFGGLAWLALVQGYALQTKEGAAGEISVETGEEPAPEKLERIPVKDNAGTHIVSVEDLLYIQAYGDYVLLFTPKGKHIKEQTMRHFETRLPDHFIRIHRSCIVNGRCIARIEQSGKENYRIRLKNGEELRVSLSGYKKLKERFL